ncbi:MAG: UDP-N-acetylmuramoyl-L-alanine--D-glutamate ligase, partial [Vicinamibacteria bacterium]|nr:UDP-N-acetylmuramoyl-L-alanine--D-glutamate ligase [Vicinamibacteria bacterium]
MEKAADVRGKRVAVIGLARSGVAAATLLLDQGARVLAIDRKAEAELDAAARALGERGAELVCGSHHPERLAAADLVVVSPGVPWDLPELDAARQAQVAVIAELELAYRHMPGTVVAITGTKGKST